MKQPLDYSSHGQARRRGETVDVNRKKSNGTHPFVCWCIFRLWSNTQESHQWRWEEIILQRNRSSWEQKWNTWLVWTCLQMVFHCMIAEQFRFRFVFIYLLFLFHFGVLTPGKNVTLWDSTAFKTLSLEFLFYFITMKSPSIYSLDFFSFF